MVDFGADDSFETAVKKVQEYYGVSVASSTTRLDVERHAYKMKQSGEQRFVTNKPQEAEIIIGQIDGSMVPIVSQKEASVPNIDKRKKLL